MTALEEVTMSNPVVNKQRLPEGGEGSRGGTPSKKTKPEFKFNEFVKTFQEKADDASDRFRVTEILASKGQRNNILFKEISLNERSWIY